MKAEDYYPNNLFYFEEMSNSNGNLIQAAYELVRVLDKAADDALPQEIADVVKLHAKLAVGSAWVPIPGADVAAGAVNIWSMYLRINGKIGMKFGESVLKTIASAVATNLASYAAVLAVGGALKFIPGLGSLSGALVMSGALYAVTLASGYVYLRALTALLKRNDVLSEEQLQESINSFMKNNSTEIKNFIDAAKKDYKQEK